MKKRHLLAFASVAFLLTGCGEIGNIHDNNEDSSGTSIISLEDKNAYLVEDVSGKKFATDDTDSYIMPDKVTLHYHRDDSSYTDKRFWLWTDLTAPEIEFEMTEDEDGWSYSYTFSPEELFKTQESGFSFMVKNTGTWTGKSAEIPIQYSEYPPTEVDGEYVLDLYIVANGATGLDVYKTKDDALSDQISTAWISDTYDKINIYTRDGTGNGESIIETVRIYKFTNSYHSFNDIQKQRYKSDYLLFEAVDVNQQNIGVQFDEKLTINCTYSIELTFKDKPDKVSTYTLTYDNLYETPEFLDLSYEADDLGAIISEDKTSTTFKVWAPTASKMQLRLYDIGYTANYLDEENFNNVVEQEKCGQYTVYEMALNPKTYVWEVTVPENLDGKFYTYRVTNTLGTNEVVDPYAKSASVDGVRGMVIDFDNELAKPEGWDDIPLVWDKNGAYDIETSQELIVSENHIRDLTMSDTWGGTKEYQGTFNGFIEKGTTYTDQESQVTVKTGYDHLIEYGVNAIQILPVFDQDNGERARKDVTYTNLDGEEVTSQVMDYDTLGDFNWGYNPLNYNVVEGSYSSDPRDGYARVKEFRQLIEQFASEEEPVRIIMDVVYNHVSSAPTSNFEKLMPKHYYRYLSDGSYSDASGCGNEVKSEAPMMRKFIVDSVSFWAETYKIKGFRFDLMGALDLGTMSAVADALYEIDPDIVVYGEGWHASAPALSRDQLAINENIDNALQPGRDTNGVEDTYEGKGFVAGFNNAGRDRLKGDNNASDGSFWGFMGKGENDLTDDINYKVQLMMMGGNGNNDSAWDPRQNINYVSCHDNYTLFDQLNYILSDDGGKTEPELDLIAKASATTNGMILTSNALSFINGGEELFRTKIEYDETVTEGIFEMYGKTISHNSYQSSDLTNAYDYSRKAELIEYFNMYKELVEIKKNLAFSQEVPSGSTGSFTCGEEAKIESNNTHGVQIGVTRKGKDGSTYHVYLVGRNATGNTCSFSTNGTVVFSSATDVAVDQLVNGTLTTNDRYALVIVEE